MTAAIQGDGGVGGRYIQKNSQPLWLRKAVAWQCAGTHQQHVRQMPVCGQHKNIGAVLPTRVWWTGSKPLQVTIERQRSAGVCWRYAEHYSPCVVVASSSGWGCCTVVLLDFPGG